MGELLAFPQRDSGDEREDGDEGAERGPAPSPVPIRPQDAATEPADVDEAPRWTVPGVDADEPVPLEPDRRSRRAENVALAALTRHDASEGEIRRTLVAKGLEPDDVEAEVGRLRRTGLLDDAAFAARQVARLRERKGLGDSAIRSALRTRLVPQEVVDAVLAEQVEDEDEALQRLQEVADDRARRLTSLSADVAERRLTAYLMRKGFSGSTVRTAVRKALEGPDPR